MCHNLKHLLIVRPYNSVHISADTSVTFFIKPKKEAVSVKPFYGILENGFLQVVEKYLVHKILHDSVRISTLLSSNL